MNRIGVVYVTVVGFILLLCPSANGAYMEDFEDGYVEGQLFEQNGWGNQNNDGLNVSLTAGNPGVAAIFPPGDPPFRFNRSFILHNVPLELGKTYHLEADVYIEPGMNAEVGLRVVDHTVDYRYLLMGIYHHQGVNSGFRLATSLGNTGNQQLGDQITSQWYRLEMDWTVGADVTMTAFDSSNTQIYQVSKDVSLIANPTEMLKLTIAGESLPGNPTEGTVTIDNISFGLAASVGVPGDYNSNGTVDAADYTLWRNSFGQSGEGLVADGDGNGSVGDEDYTFWKSRFGNTSGAGSAAHIPVPEPMSLLLIAVCLPFFCLPRQARRM